MADVIILTLPAEDIITAFDWAFAAPKATCVAMSSDTRDWIEKTMTIPLEVLINDNLPIGSLVLSRFDDKHPTGTVIATAQLRGLQYQDVRP